jgi:hypothetical protein
MGARPLPRSWRSTRVVDQFELLLLIQAALDQHASSMALVAVTKATRQP